MIPQVIHHAQLGGPPFAGCSFNHVHMFSLLLAVLFSPVVITIIVVSSVVNRKNEIYSILWECHNPENEIFTF